MIQVHPGPYMPTDCYQLSKLWRETGSKCVNLVNHVVFKNLANNTRFSFHCGDPSVSPRTPNIHFVRLANVLREPTRRLHLDLSIYTVSSPLHLVPEKRQLFELWKFSFKSEATSGILKMSPCKCSSTWTTIIVIWSEFLANIAAAGICPRTLPFCGFAHGQHSHSDTRWTWTDDALCDGSSWNDISCDWIYSSTDNCFLQNTNSSGTFILFDEYCHYLSDVINKLVIQWCRIYWIDIRMNTMTTVSEMIDCLPSGSVSISI